jgi:hypothetical protein
MNKPDWSKWQRQVILEEYMEHISPQIKEDNQKSVYKKSATKKEE